MVGGQKKRFTTFWSTYSRCQGYKKNCQKVLNYKFVSSTSHYLLFPLKKPSRPKNEVDFLMKLFIDSIKNELEELLLLICKA